MNQDLTDFYAVHKQCISLPKAQSNLKKVFYKHEGNSKILNILFPTDRYSSKDKTMDTETDISSLM